MESIVAIFRKVKKFFSFNYESNRAAVTFYRLSNANNRKVSKA
ncbi:MAG: hypothetical protein ACKOX3_10615 [Bacteroidota bacterium]